MICANLRRKFGLLRREFFIFEVRTLNQLGKRIAEKIIESEADSVKEG
jgi:hypothetical protein